MVNQRENNMTQSSDFFYDPWPELSYEAFKPTLPLLHMITQIIGKLKISQPFEPHWANVALWLTAGGLTTGPLIYKGGIYSIEIDLIEHKIICKTSWGRATEFNLESMSVAYFYKTFFSHLSKIDVEVSINPLPQEVANPIVFTEDTTAQPYEDALVNTWWRIMLSTYRVMQRYHARFTGRTPPIGLMWGTLDLRDARYKGTPVPITAPNTDYIRRNAMDDAQVEAGWWCGNPTYPKPAFFSFTFPEPKGISNAAILPRQAKWEPTLGEFILDYDDLRKSKQPDIDLLNFFESTYAVGTQLAGWNADLIGPGKPI